MGRKVEGVAVVEEAPARDSRGWPEPRGKVYHKHVPNDFGFIDNSFGYQ